MDQLSYTYNDATNNRLNRVADAIGTTQGDDFGGSSSYGYDAIGNLVHDEQEEIESIEWTVSGKVRKVTRTTGSTKPNLEFFYDAMGNRVGKLVTTPGQPDQKTIYTLDASGQLMATYSVSNAMEVASATLLELPLYGSQRLGSFNANVEVAHHEMGGATQKISFWETFRKLGSKYYELTNHLGNVLVVISDRKKATAQDGTFSHYSADVVSVTDYYPFGMQMPGRMMNTGEYRYGFNGQEKDDEVAGEGNSNTAKYWQYDTRLGRRWNTDPVVKDWESPYACFSDNPIYYSDPSGADSEDPPKKGDTFIGDDGQTYTNSCDAVEIICSEKFSTSYTITLDYEIIQPKYSWIPFNYPDVKVLNTGVITEYNAQPSDERQISVTIMVPVVYINNLDNPSYDVYTYTGNSLEGINNPDNWVRQPNYADAFFAGFAVGIVAALTNEVLMELQVSIATSKTMQRFIPQEARNVVDYAKKNHGAVQPGYAGGNVYRNNPKWSGTTLPKKTGSGRNITYKEYKITPIGTPRGRTRVVIGSDGRYWYTSDHYKTFIQIL